MKFVMHCTVKYCNFMISTVYFPYYLPQLKRASYGFCDRSWVTSFSFDVYRIRFEYAVNFVQVFVVVVVFPRQNLFL